MGISPRSDPLSPLSSLGGRCAASRVTINATPLAFDGAPWLLKNPCPVIIQREADAHGGTHGTRLSAGGARKGPPKEQGAAGPAIRSTGISHSIRRLSSTLSDRLSFWRTEEWKLRQRFIYFVLELGNGNLEKLRTDLGRGAHQDSKDEAVPEKRLKHK